ncbi:hypothetical protein CLOSTMETH_00413 [[Clostridium] methylpentosum DSM 5476]|uniref:Transposase IS200-like domain-containing protein n=1 Tax=[Clostridium] methylpentosum DSM 5476 TaxID=537013 RepID=C0E9B5_9FIRM|nr:hypothetical protein CLOSTMETH_00413 [[Clostridium] methylpentosum DSM 5476]
MEKKTRDRRKFANAVKLGIRNVEAEVCPGYMHIQVGIPKKVDVSSFMW